MSASFPHATIECHSVFSWRWPSCPVHWRDVASRKLATRWPPGVDRTSGSDPRLPTRMTLFTPATVYPQSKDVCVGAYDSTIGARGPVRQGDPGGLAPPEPID